MPLHSPLPMTIRCSRCSGPLWWHSSSSRGAWRCSGCSWTCSVEVRDLSPWRRAGWVLLILWLMALLLGMAVYSIVRGDRVTERLRDLDPGDQRRAAVPVTRDCPTGRAACRDAPLVATCRREGPARKRSRCNANARWRRAGRASSSSPPLLRRSEPIAASFVGQWARTSSSRPRWSRCRCDDTPPVTSPISPTILRFISASRTTFAFHGTWGVVPGHFQSASSSPVRTLFVGCVPAHGAASLLADAVAAFPSEPQRRESASR